MNDLKRDQAPKPEPTQERVLVTGGAGMLGSQVLLAVTDGLEVIGTDLREAHGVAAVGYDLADAVALERLLGEFGPFTGVIHTAAYTAVDKAEEEPELAARVNGEACRALASACAAQRIPLVVVSTDFVFDGNARTPYAEDHPTNPLSVYGKTKLAGEIAAREAHPGGTRIVRTQWLYGPRGKHFPRTMLQLAQERDQLRVVSDQIGSPTSTLELAPALWDVLLEGEAGVYHAACEGSCSWFDLAVATLEHSGTEGVTVEPCTTEEFPRPAHRPPYSVLDCSRLAALRGAPLAPWEDALKTYLGTDPS
ncbi:MAG: dTDP-4-dehydrorhamnose reductase [bacterium]|nr:dTDP-4-dehydrorhamnose reductase [bacterium]